MSKKNHNKKSSWFVIAIVAVAVLGLGYLLGKSSPTKTNQTAADQTAVVDDMHGSSAASNTEQLNALVGKPMPSIQLTDKDGKTFSPADFKGKYVVLFFNEGLMCYPACWNQIASFGSDGRFNSDTIQAISAVTDSAADWRTAIEKMPELAKATTMFDVGANASRQLGMLTTDSSMHRGSLPGHTYVVVDKEGIVRFVFDDPNMAIANEMLFNKVQELNK
jgi:peroxiredoxin Q/BCP